MVWVDFDVATTFLIEGPDEQRLSEEEDTIVAEFGELLVCLALALFMWMKLTTWLSSEQTKDRGSVRILSGISAFKLDERKPLKVELCLIQISLTNIYMRTMRTSSRIYNSPSRLVVVWPPLNFFDKMTSHTNYLALVDKEVRVLILVYLLEIRLRPFVKGISHAFLMLSCSRRAKSIGTYHWYVYPFLEDSTWLGRSWWMIRPVWWIVWGTWCQTNHANCWHQDLPRESIRDPKSISIPDKTRVPSMISIDILPLNPCAGMRINNCPFHDWDYTLA